VVEVGGGWWRLLRSAPPPTSPNLHNLHAPPRQRYLGAMSTDGPLRRPIPVARSILWSPASEGGGGGAQRPGHMPFPVFLSQSALRSEEHTSELQSLAYLVCRLLLE